MNWAEAFNKAYSRLRVGIPLAGLMFWRRRALIARAVFSHGITLYSLPN